jgi:hypothetical protein
VTRAALHATALAALLTFAMAPSARAAAIALTDATVHTVSGPVLEHATVVRTAQGASR